MRILFAVDLAMLEPGGGGAENKIGGAFDIAMIEILARTRLAGKQNILVAEKAAIAEGSTIACNAEGHGLPGGEARIILKADTARAEIIGRYEHALRRVRIDGIAP